jgi:hypothetical protein
MMLLALALSTAATVAGISLPWEQRTIPRPYRGDWALTPGQCAPGPADSGNIRVTARTIRTFESRIDIIRVVSIGTSSIGFATRVSHSGAVYGDHSRLTLLNNAISGDLDLGVGDGEDQDIYVRCRR